MKENRDRSSKEDGKRLTLFFAGLADKNRLRILNLLFYGELCGCDVQYVLGAPQSNISRHLTYLRNSRLVLNRRSGYRTYYRLPTELSADHKLLFEYLQRAFKHDDLFTEDLHKLKEAIKKGACTVSEQLATVG